MTKIGKRNVAIALVMMSLTINIFLILKIFSFPRQWSLNNEIGWGIDITFLWLRELLIFFILPNLFWGILMSYPIWNRYLADRSMYTKKKLVVPVIAAFAVWIMFFAMGGNHMFRFYPGL